MTVTVSSWYDELLVHAPGASIGGMQQALDSALAEFLRRSGAYVKDLSGISLRAGKEHYYIPQPSEGPVLFVHALMFNQKPLRPLMIPQWQARTVATGVPTHFRRYLDDANKFSVSPVPVDDTGVVYPYVAFGYNPELRDHLPDLFKLQWYDAILDGALYRLCSQQNKPYSDPTMALVRGKSFRAAIAQARDEARKQFTTMETPWRYPAWA